MTPQNLTAHLHIVADGDHCDSTCPHLEHEEWCMLFRRVLDVHHRPLGTDSAIRCDSCLFIAWKREGTDATETVDHPDHR